MRIVPFEPSHCNGAKAHASQIHYQYLFDKPSNFSEVWLETRSALDRGDLIAIGGTKTGRGLKGGWVLFTNKITPARFLTIHRVIMRTLSEMDGALIAHVDPRNPKAARWVISFASETSLSASWPATN